MTPSRHADELLDERLSHRSGARSRRQTSVSGGALLAEAELEKDALREVAKGKF